ncbi:Sugar phosphate permease [Raineyella antarctica]|uniref:Sugar phosphate permease n=1 Tax=Raineyella antarctica TaxID=1577474 RepID=A0A1G6GPP7_9ACTN|nr:MFS transporter [Raineyella antarctica]SDB83735.1 Sugar phosphate permease [Raineyella antarctica]
MSPVNGRRAWLVWLTGVLVYAVAVMQRSSFGVAGLEAAQHFSAGAGIVSMFVVLQLGVYAAAQVPVGLALDRLGSRTVVTAGALVMAVGQLMVGSTDSITVAIIGRILVGLGDAMTFNSVIRLVPYWFANHRVPIMTQLTGMLGQLGQILSAVPFLSVLVTYGWRPAFFAAAGTAVLGAALMWVFGRNAPPGRWQPDTTASLGAVTASLRAILREPHTSVGFWIHFTTCFSTMMFPLMWGYPYLTAGLGYSPAVASALLSVFALVAIPVGPLVGRLTARHPRHRSGLALALITLQLVAWTGVLLWPGVPPVWALVVLITALAMGGPGSNIGFDYVRTSQPPQRVGTGTGIVLMGGFTAALVSVLFIGLALDLLTGGGGYDQRSFTIGMTTQAPIYAVGLAGILLSRRRLRTHPR